MFGRPAALFCGLVLSTTFGFLYVHSGRSGNTDALFTLLLLLTAVTLWGADDRPGRLIWLGPLTAVVFLLRGTAVLMPLAFVAIVLLLDARRLRARAAPLLAAAALLVLPVAAWVGARWQLDGWAFIGRMVQYDLVARTASALEGHRGGPLYYLNVLQKDQFDWLIAATASSLLLPPSREFWRRMFRHVSRYQCTVLACWAGITLAVPTLMQTKLAWYLNPFFPVLALFVSLLIAQAISSRAPVKRWRRWVLAGVLVLIPLGAESRLLWYSRNVRDVNDSTQGLILDRRAHLRGSRVFKSDWPNAERFVLEHVVGGRAVVAGDWYQFVADGRQGDFMIMRKGEATSAACLPHQGPFVLCPHPESE
jgi:4-amino-4-deoxy-L-arabinose transferase-like glycosyltransferase